jgi:hypothetical protein
MIERVRPLLKLEGLLRPSLSVTLPGKVDAAGQRDGLQPGKAPSPLRLGEKAWHLCQMLAFVPATVWSEQWRKTPEQVLEMAGRSDEAAILREGWSRAAQNHPQLAWTTALIHHGGTVVDLVNALPPDQRESCIISLVNAKAYEDNDTLFQWLGTCRHGWSEAYGRLVIEQVRQVVAAPGQQNQNRNRLLLFGHYFPPQLIEEAARVWKPHPDNTDIWQPVIDNFLELLHFRREMLAALT